jgi:hypothetical protein
MNVLQVVGALRLLAPVSLCLLAATASGCAADASTDEVDTDDVQLDALKQQDIDVGDLWNKAKKYTSCFLHFESKTAGLPPLPGSNDCGGEGWNAVVASLRVAGFTLSADFFEHSLMEGPTPWPDHPKFIEYVKAQDGTKQLVDLCLKKAYADRPDGKPPGPYGGDGKGATVTDWDYNIQNPLDAFGAIGQAKANCKSVKTKDGPNGSEWTLDIYVVDDFHFDWDLSGFPDDPKKFLGHVVESAVAKAQMAGLVHTFPTGCHFQLTKSLLKGGLPAEI